METVSSQIVQPLLGSFASASNTQPLGATVTYLCDPGLTGLPTLSYDGVGEAPAWRNAAVSPTVSVQKMSLCVDGLTGGGRT